MLGFGPTMRLFEVLGFEIRVHASWVIIFLLLAWSLATGWFPLQIEGLSVSTYWLMGVTGSLGLFVSIVLHELAHSVVARRRGLEMRGITLFLFGGVAEMTDEPEDPTTELLVAVAGPAASVAIAIVCFLATSVGRSIDLPVTVTEVTSYLGVLNLVLVAFNIVPAFPLDGGRVLRAALWRLKGDLAGATRVASQSGSLFGAVLIFLGVLSVLAGNLIGGIWFALIGMFLRGAAQTGYQRLLLRELLAGESVRRFATTEVVTVPAETSIAELVENFVYRHHFKGYPVTDGGGVVGVVDVQAVKEVPRERWDSEPVRTIMQPIEEALTLAPSDDALEGLKKMHQTGQSRLLVTEGDRLVGILSLKDLMELFQLKVELGLDSRTGIAS